jgi:RNA polymerase sigma factor (sigma-70 family)
MTWQQWLSENYTTLEYWSKRRDFTNWSDLITQLTLHLQKNWTTFNLIPDDKKIAWCQGWFKNQVRWLNSKHNVDVFGDELGGRTFMEFKTEIFDCEEEEDFDKNCDYTDEERLWIDDLSDSQISKIKKIKLIYKGLSNEEQVLFDLYFKEMLSQRQIAEKINIPLSAVYNMLKALKTKIKNEF